LEIASESQLESLIQNLVNIGMGAIEVYYPQHTAEQTEQFERLAKQNDLLLTGGTDFHGALTPEIQMGSGSGNLFISHHIYEALMGAIC
ncbi:MAG: PHP domain-containing protein, partial [Deltaproteobacteria bacterium]|nr:PHP domain-containing protein [Deltaproteobacteria bacterium]